MINNKKAGSSNVPLLRPMRSHIQPFTLGILVRHPSIHHALLKGLPVVRIGVRDRQHLNTSSPALVTPLRRHEHIAAAHDAALERETHRGAAVRGFLVHQVDDVPPSTLQHAQVRLAGIRGLRR